MVETHMGTEVHMALDMVMGEWSILVVAEASDLFIFAGNQFLSPL